MSDETRIERLTELARRVWPDCSDVEIVSGPRGPLVAGDDPELGRITLLYMNHRASPVPLTRALEAALHVLAGEPKGVIWPEWDEGPKKPPAWAKQLASEWEARAAQYEAAAPNSDDPRENGVMIAMSVAYSRAAAQLRERAKQP